RKRVTMNENLNQEQVCDGPYSLEEKFQACVDIIQNLPKTGPVPTTYVEMLTMYALFKQATHGPCNVTQPGFWNVIERYKWDAWNRLGEMDKDEAMETYVAGVLEKVDYCADQWDWDEMLTKYAKDYDKLEPILREKFRIIDRELIKADGTKDRRSRTSSSRATGVLSFTPDRKKTREQLSVEIPAEKETALTNESATPNDPLSDAEYCDARDDRSISRSSSFSLHDPQQISPGRVKSLKAYCARMDVELRAINAALTALTTASDARYQTIMKLIKNSAIYIAVPSRLSWRSLFFFLIWPFIVHWALKYFGGAHILY
ncbi:hypothetical protein PFISCL1PPCAC_11349, partial [Pristionchus fissidentatus]